MADNKNIQELYANMLYDNLKDSVQSVKLTPLNITAIIVSAMQLVEKIPNLSGKDKKNLVLHVLQRYNNDFPSDNPISMNMLPSFIDMAVSLDRKEVTIKIDKQGCLNCCFALLSKHGRLRAPGAPLRKKQN